MERMDESVPTPAGTEGYAASDLEEYVASAVRRRDDLRSAIDAARLQAHRIDEVAASAGSVHEEIGRSWLATQREADAIRAEGDARAERLLREAERTATHLITTAFDKGSRPQAAAPR